MKYLLIFTLLFTVNRCYSQDKTVTVYHHKAKDFNYILLLGCSVGYSYTGPHLFTDEVFAYEIRKDRIIRTFDTEYSLRKRIDTLIIDRKSLRDIDGLSLKRVSSQRKDELIERYIQPTAGSGFYKIFLERIDSCKEDK